MSTSTPYRNNTKKYSELTPLTSKTARRELNVKESETEVPLPLSREISGAIRLSYDCDDDWTSAFDASLGHDDGVPFECSNCDELKKENERLKATVTQLKGLLNAPPGTAAYLSH
ncbi:uncharacterized protein LOC114530411 [Dendronephthya gigantea]|uniref:uncharacterized protein LOC114530411 n=1 Tax=Dendronephthya gigantea TaxID=151771 RepID=UPI00106DC43E|nr:uncharacterized protein LOC114530411 [Dendronephthya gigantea]